jgi:hypothetical protein
MAGAYMPIMTQAGGMCLGVPDVCLVPAPPAPPIPTPFPNIAQCSMAVGTCPTVLAGNMPVVTQSSVIPISSGDEAGVAGGVMSGMFIGPCTFKMFSSKVSAGGQKVVVLTNMTGHNGMSPNMPAGLAVAPSQAQVMASL